MERAGPRRECWPLRSRPSPARKALLALTLESQRMWPVLRANSRRRPGISVGYRDEGTIVVALTRDDAEQLRFTYDFQKSLGLELDGCRGRRRGVASRICGRAFPAQCFSPRDHQVDNRRLARALAKAARRAGAVLHEHHPVREVEIAGGRVRAVVTDASAANRPMSSCWRPGPGRAKSPAFPRLTSPPSARSKDRCWRCAWIRQKPLLRHVVWAAAGLSRAAPRWPARGRWDGRGARLRRHAHGRRLAGVDRRRLARRAGDRGAADRRDLGRFPSGFARRCADARSERDRRARHRDRTSPQRNSADAADGRGDQRLSY